MRFSTRSLIICMDGMNRFPKWLASSTMRPLWSSCRLSFMIRTMAASIKCLRSSWTVCSTPAPVSRSPVDPPVTSGTDRSTKRGTLTCRVLGSKSQLRENVSVSSWRFFEFPDFVKIIVISSWIINKILIFNTLDTTPIFPSRNCNICITFICYI